MAKNVTTMTTNCRLTNNCSHHPRRENIARGVHIRLVTI